MSIFIPELWKQEGLLKTYMYFSVTVAGNHIQILKKMLCLCLELVIHEVNFWEGPDPRAATETPQQRAKWRFSSSVSFSESLLGV